MEGNALHHTWACGSCGCGSAQPPGITSIRCDVCRGVTEFRRCPKCGLGLALSPQMRGIKHAGLRCTGCGEEGKPKHFPSVGIEHVPPPVGFVEAYDRIGLSYEACTGFTGRRSFHGALVGSSGLSAVSVGASTGVSLYFETMTLVACIGTMSNAGCIPLADLTSLSLLGRDEFLSSVDDATSNSLASSVASSLASRPAARSETVCSITWDDGGIVVLNQTMTPKEANERFEPVLHRAYRARSDAKESMLDQFARLIVMHDTGMMSDDEYDTESTRTLGPGPST